MFSSPEQLVQSAMGQTPQPEIFVNAQVMSNNRGIGIGKGGVAQSRQYKKTSVNSKTGSGIVPFSSS